MLLRPTTTIGTIFSCSATSLLRYHGLWDVLQSVPRTHKPSSTEKSWLGCSSAHWSHLHTSSFNTRFTRSQEVSDSRFQPEMILTIVAYSIYALFEWALVLLDVGFDAVTFYDFASFEIVVRDVKGLSRGYVHRLPR